MQKPTALAEVAAAATGLRLLIVEDSRDDAELSLREIRKAGFAAEADVVQTASEFAERLRQREYDVILADYHLPDFSGLEAFSLVAQTGLDIPFILVTGSLGEETAVECMKVGITDYVLKHQLAKLPVAVRGALAEKALREERERSAEALRERDASFRLLFAANPLPMYLFDRETLQFLEVNDAMVLHYGYSREEFLRMKVTDIRPPDEVPRLLDFLKHQFRDLHHAGSWKHRRKDGRPLDVQVIAQMLDFAGRPAGLVIAQDVTQQRLAQELLQVSERRYRQLYERNLAGVFRSTINGHMLDANEACARILGYSSREEFLRQGMNQFYQDAAERETFLERIRKEGSLTNYETWRQRKDGSLICLLANASLVPDESGELAVVEGTIIDITTRKQAEEALRESEARYRDLFESATYGIYRATPDGELLDVNPALVTMLGYESQAEVLAVKNVHDVYRDPRCPEYLVEQCRKTGRVDLQTEWKRKDGRVIKVRLNGRRVRDKARGLDCLEVIVEDVTERLALETQLHQAQKFEAIGQLAGGIAHDFNNMIGAILGWAELGGEETSPDSRVYSHFQKIRQQGERAAALTRQLLTFARRQILEPRNIDLNQAVHEVLSLLEKVIGGDIELETQLAPDLAVVRADPTQVEQVLMNLCLNARDAMPQGGRLRIETANVEFDEKRTRRFPHARPGRFIRLVVSDTGVGMDVATLDRMFEPFFTTKEIGKGTGLGLATVYGIVKQHNGFVHVTSELGLGSSFHAYLPVSQSPVDAVSGTDAEQVVLGGTETILVAEDHEGLREIARETLARLGYRVMLALDGEEAVQKFQACRDEVALVLLDVVLPKLSGPRAYVRMCQEKAGVPVIFATGYSADTAILAAVQNGDFPLLQKPYSPRDLARRVREVLDEHEEGLKPSDGRARTKGKSYKGDRRSRLGSKGKAANSGRAPHPGLPK